MADYVTKIRTIEGDKQIDFNALANLPASETYITADEREYWNKKMDPADVLSDESAALYGLEKGASSDDVFSFLGKYNQHWWKLVTNSRVTKYEEKKRTFAEEYDEVIHLYKKSGTIFYADDYTIDEDTGYVSLVNQSQMNANDDWSILYGKYIQSTNGGITATNYTDNIEENVVDVIYHSSNPYATYDNAIGTDNFKPGRGYAATCDGYESFAVVLAISYMLNVGEVEYKYSTKRNEYPDSGTVNGVMYDYLGIPFDNISQSTKMDVKIGDIKYSFDTDQGEDWILADGSTLSHTEYPEIGNFLKNNLTVVPTKINNSELYSSWRINDVVCVNGLYVGAGHAQLKTESVSKASIFYTNDLYGTWDVLVINDVDGSSSYRSFDRISYGNGQYVAYSSNYDSTIAFASQSPKTSWTKINAFGCYAHIMYGNGYWVLVSYTTNGNSSKNKSFYYTSNIFNGFDGKTYVTCIDLPVYATKWAPMFHDNTLCVVASNGGSDTYLLTSEDFINGGWKTTKISNFYGISIQYINGMYIITGGQYNKNSYYPGFAFSNNLTDGWKTISIHNSNIANNSYDKIARPIAYDEIGKRWAVAYAGNLSIYVYLSEDANLEGTWSLYQFSRLGTSYPSTNLFLNNNKFAYISNNNLISNEYFTIPKLHDTKNGYSTYIKIR